MDQSGNKPAAAGAGAIRDGRGPDGRFAAGNPGKPKGAKRKVTLAMEAILEQAAEKLTEQLVGMASKGELAALRMCLDRVAPPRRERLVEFDLPPVDSAEDAQRASSALLSAIAGGEMSPYEGQHVMAMLVAHKTIVEAGDIERRLTALEKGIAP